MRRVYDHLNVTVTLSQMHGFGRLGRVVAPPPWVPGGASVGVFLGLSWLSPGACFCFPLALSRLPLVPSGPLLSLLWSLLLWLS